MAEYTRLQQNFSSGYIDPTLHGAFNSELYSTGLKECLNFIPSANGYLFRRPGTRYTGLSIPGTACRFRTVRTETGPVIIVITEGKLTIYSEEDEFSIDILDGESDATGYVNSIPWTPSELEELDIAEFEGSLYIVHKNHPPFRILKASEGISAIEMAEEIGDAPYGPVTEPEEAVSFEDIAGSGLFQCGPVVFKDGGEKFDMEGMHPTCQTFKGSRWFLSGCADKPANIFVSKAPFVDGRTRFDDFGLGEAYVLKVTSKLTKTTVWPDASHAGTPNISYDSDGDTEETRFYARDIAGEFEVPDSTFEVKYSYDGGAEIDIPPEQYSSPYARLVERSIGTTYTLSSDIRNDDGIELVEADMFGSKMQWLLTQQRVIAGTQRSIWMDNGEPAAPSTFDMVQTLSAATCEVRPAQWGSLIIYAAADRRSVNAFYYDDNAGGYKLLPISQTAKSLFTSNVKALAVTEGYETILWVLLEEGTILSCTLGGQMYGWAKHTFRGGTPSSIFPYQGVNGECDLYIAMIRNGNTRIEKLTIEDLVHTQTYNLEDSDGYRIESKAALLWQELPAETAQTSLGKKRKIIDMIMQVYRSRGAEVGYITDGSEHVKRVQSKGSLLLSKRPAQTRTTSFTALIEGEDEYYSGLIRLPLPSYTTEIVSTVFRTDSPEPLTIQSVETKYIIQEA